METLYATGTVQGVFFSLGTTPATSDSEFDYAHNYTEAYTGGCDV